MSKPLDGVRVFLSGPMSGIDGNNVVAFLDAHRRLRDLGAAYVYDPAAEWVVELRNGGETGSHEYYMRKCIHELTRVGFDPDMDGPFYDVLIQLDGWEASDGAIMERSVAVSCGIEVVEMKRLGAWTKGGKDGK